MRSAVQMCLLGAIPVLLLIGCGEDNPGSNGVTEAEPPGDIFGLIGEFGDCDRDLVMAFAWSVDDPAGVTGFHVYRSIEPGEYECITVDPVEFVEGDGFRYLDCDADVLSMDEHSYYSTAVGPLQMESAPSEEVFVVPGAISNDEHVAGLSPSGDSTVASMTPTFSWTAKDGATTYCMILQEWDAPESPIVWMYRNSGTSFVCGAAYGATYVPLDSGQLQPDTHYRWQILAVSASNMVFAWQEAFFWTPA